MTDTLCIYHMQTIIRKIIIDVLRNLIYKNSWNIPIGVPPSWRTRWRSMLPLITPMRRPRIPGGVGSAKEMMVVTVAVKMATMVKPTSAHAIPNNLPATDRGTWFSMCDYSIWIWNIYLGAWIMVWYIETICRCFYSSLFCWCSTYAFAYHLSPLICFVI